MSPHPTPAHAARKDMLTCTPNFSRSRSPVLDASLDDAIANGRGADGAKLGTSLEDVAVEDLGAESIDLAL